MPSPPVVVVDGAVEEVLDGYRCYMLSERGVKERTVAGYEPNARVFLSQREGLEGLGLERLTAADVSAFLARECPLRTVARGAVLGCCAALSACRWVDRAAA